MALFRRQVSALLVLLALVASACSSDPTEVVAADDPDAVTAVVDVTDVVDVGVGDDEASSADSTGSVGDESAPVEVPPELLNRDVEAMRSELEAAGEQWEAAGIDDYDYSYALVEANNPELGQVSIRGGTVEESVAGEFGEFEAEFGSLSELLEMLANALLDDGSDGITAIDYHPTLGYPTFVTGISDGAPASIEIFRFRTPDVYPETCSVEDQGFTVGNDNEIGQTHALLLEAAQNCDWLMLSHLADLGSEEVTLSFGGGGVEMLWEDEANGGDRMSTLAELLAEEPTFIDGGLAVWPPGYADPDSGYLDYRVGIDEGGEWLFFVAGD